MRMVLLCIGLGLAATATSARAERTDGDKLAILEASDGELAFTGPTSQFHHGFMVSAETAEPVTVLDVRVPDFADGAGHQVPVRWSWVGPRPGIIELRAPATLLIESTLPAPATYRTMIEVIYSSRDATGKDMIRPLRIPLRVERTVVTPPAPETELPIAGIDGDTIEVEILRGPATAHVALVVRGTGTQPVTIDRAVLITAARKGSGAQLVENAAVATVTRGLPTTIARGEVRTIALEVSRLEGPGVFDTPGSYDGKLLVVNATTGATKVIGFTVVVHRCAGVALALTAVGVLVSLGTRRWLQKGRARAIARRDLSVLRSALSRALTRDPGDADRNAAMACVQRLSELLGNRDDAGASPRSRCCGDVSRSSMLSSRRARPWR